MMARFFVNRPIVAIVMAIVMVILGLVALSRLPNAQYPEIVPPQVQLTTNELENLAAYILSLKPN